MNHDPFADPFLPRLLIDERDMFSRNVQRENIAQQMSTIDKRNIS